MSEFFAMPTTLETHVLYIDGRDISETPGHEAMSIIRLTSWPNTGAWAMYSWQMPIHSPREPSRAKRPYNGSILPP